MHYDWFSKYKVFRRLAILFVGALITYATIRVFSYNVTATAEYVALLGLFTAATTFYMAWEYDHDSKESSNDKR